MNSNTWVFLFGIISFFSAHTSMACTQEFKPVCGYWMHSPKTETFKNECLARASGALIRHTGTCQSAPAKAGPGKKTPASPK
jgi:hypothetical protein